MSIKEAIIRSTQDECREIGEILVALAESPRDGTWRGKIESAFAPYESDQDRSLIAAIEKGRKRVEALGAGLVADGTDHETLLLAELHRRGDGRSVKDYCDDVAGGRLHSNVI